MVHHITTRGEKISTDEGEIDFNEARETAG